jgi:glycosyltransferase involved in cell wall biosynthesis
MGPRISVVVNTLNEELNLPYALRSVRPWADEIVVVDMQSTDHTVEIARNFGAKLYHHDPTGFVEPARAFAIAQATGDWILVLDADEMVPVGLSHELKRLAASDSSEVVILPRANYLLGATLEHTGWGPRQDMLPRFFKKNCIVASGIIHRDLVPAPGAKVSRLDYNGQNALIHFNYLDSTQFIAKLNSYTSVEALQSLERTKPERPFVALLKALKEFLIRYLRQGGYRDGWRGFYLSLFMGFYRLTVSAKLKELQTSGSRERIRAMYAREAERILAGYERKA